MRRDQEANMTQLAAPYAVPTNIGPRLTRVLAYWESLKRAENSMPFWDDVKPSSLPDLAEDLLMIDVFEKPQRHRMSNVGRRLTDAYGAQVAGTFVDEMETKSPFDYLLSQCAATVEARAPTCYRHAPQKPETSRSAGRYSRLLLPLWGDGHVGMLLGAVDLH
jgi:hypothetical protein